MQHRTKQIPFSLRNIFAGLLALPLLSTAQTKDTLQQVTITAHQQGNRFTELLPTQQIDGSALRQLNSYSAGDIAKYFAGVLVKDYGGIGGLKTVSVRSLGASHTGVLYDGVPVADMQAGQTDLGRFSSSFLSGMELSQGNLPQALMPARAYASSAMLGMRTQMADNQFAQTTKWAAGIKAGSFGHWQPFVAVATPISQRTVISANAEYTQAEGDYPFIAENGILSEKRRRINSDVSIWQGEINATTRLADSSLWQIKAWGYTSERGLPGAVISFNDRSVQRLWDNDFFVQSTLQKTYKKGWRTGFAVKYNYQQNRYLDPDFAGTTGPLDNRYKQQEWYGSASVHKSVGHYITLLASTDAAYTTLDANVRFFVGPSRISSWSVAGAKLAMGKWQASATGLFTYLHDNVDSGNAGGSKNRLTPTITLAYKPSENSPWLFRAFYKRIFRMPTFNDLYYVQVGNRNLKPEYANQYNIGATYTRRFNTVIDKFNISVDGYYNRVKDKIIAVPGTNLFIWSMLNRGKVNIYGADVATELTGKIAGSILWQSRIAYTYQYTQDLTDPTLADYKDQLPYTPNHSGAGFLQMQYQQWTLGYSCLFSGKRYALGGNNPYNLLRRWSTHDINISRTINIKKTGLLLRGELNNITNERYAIIRNYPMQGRSFKVSISIANF